ncbi:hypothetical protein V8C43DRAFT_262638 [Trichoderma afarasin]
MLAELQTKRTRQRRTNRVATKAENPPRRRRFALCPTNANLAPTYFAFCWCCCCGFQQFVTLWLTLLYSPLLPPSIWCCRNPGYHHLPSLRLPTSATVQYQHQHRFRHLLFGQSRVSAPGHAVASLRRNPIPSS